MATEFVGIQLELMGADGVRSDLQQLDKLLNSFRGRKKFDAGFNEARNQVVAYKGELEKLQREQKKWRDLQKRVGKENMSAFGLRDMERNAQAIDETKRKLREAQQAVREFGRASSEAGRTAMQTFNAYSSRIAHVGSALQSFGNAMTALTSPFRRITDGVLMGTGYKLLNSFTQGIEDGFTRYDTMKKFPKIMSALGYNAKESQDAIDRLDASVQGLPIALNEAVNMAQRYISTTGDLNKGTDLAIATNNAFLASMSTETQRYQGLMQLQDVVGGKKLNSREWYSLANSMMPAIRQMGVYLGYTGDALDEYVAKVQQGKIANEDFIKTLIAAGTDTNGTIHKMAQESKDTYEAFFSRIGTAASRMMFGVIKSLDAISQSLTGIDVNQLLDNKIIPAIDNTTASIKGWIDAHPEEIADFFKELSKINVKGLLEGYAKGMLQVLKVGEKFMNLFDGKGMKTLGWILGWGGAAGRGSTILGGFLKGTRHIWAIVGLLAKIGGKKFGGGFGGKLGKIGIFGKIASFFGKKKTIEEAGEIGGAVTKASPRLLAALKNVAMVSGILGIPAITAVGISAAARGTIKNFKETINLLKDIDWDDAKKVLAGIGGFLGVSASIGGLLGTKAGIKVGSTVIIGEVLGAFITGIASASLAFDMKMIKTGLKNFADGIKALDQIPDIKNADDLFNRVKNAIDVYNKISTLLNGEAPTAVNAYTATHSSGGAKGLGLFKALAIKNLAGAIDALVDAGRSLQKVSTIEIPSNAESKVSKLAKTVANVANSFSVFSWNFISSSLIKGTMKNIANQLLQLRRMAYHINQLAGTDVNTGGFSSFIEQLKTALESLKDLSGVLELDIEVELSPNFKKSVNEAVKQIKDGKKKLQNAAKGLENTTISATIPVTLRARVNTMLATRAITSGVSEVQQAARNAVANYTATSNGYQSRGGAVYRAKGGGIGFPGRPRGTDTVPTWLTPGEWVHNKQAVDTFGINFMRKVNNLDVRGAMAELMHRAGNMANVNRGTVITNNNYNNQKVTINNNAPSSAGFTFKSASRFVGAL